MWCRRRILGVLRAQKKKKRNDKVLRKTDTAEFNMEHAQGKEERQQSNDELTERQKRERFSRSKCWDTPELEPQISDRDGRRETSNI